MVKTATIERYHVYGTHWYSLSLRYRGLPIGKDEIHIGASDIEALRARARSHGFTHVKYAGDWAKKTKPRNGKL